MAQLQQPIPTGAVTPRGPFGTATARSPRLALVGAGLAVIIGGSALAAIVIDRAPAAQAPEALSQGAVVDGWMPALAAANRERRLAAADLERDGWQSYLFSTQER